MLANLKFSLIRASHIKPADNEKLYKSLIGVSLERPNFDQRFFRPVQQRNSPVTLAHWVSLSFSQQKKGLKKFLCKTVDETVSSLAALKRVTYVKMRSLSA